MGKRHKKRKERPSSSGDDSLPLADIQNKHIEYKRRKGEEEEDNMEADGNSTALTLTVQDIKSDLLKSIDKRLENLSTKQDINKLRQDVEKAFESFIFP